MDKHRDGLYTAIENKKEEIETAKEELKEMEEHLRERPNTSPIETLEVQGIKNPIDKEIDIEAYMEVHKSEIAKLESRIMEKNKVIEALNEHNKKLKNEIFRLNKEINKTTLEKRYIINIKENMRKLLGED